MKIEQEFDGATFIFRLSGQELRIPLEGQACGADIEKKALAWARAINPAAKLEE